MTDAVLYKDQQLELTSKETVQRNDKVDHFLNQEKTHSYVVSCSPQHDRIFSTSMEQSHVNIDKGSQESKDMTEVDHRSIVDSVRVDIDTKGPTKSNTCENCGQELIKDCKSSNTSIWKSESSLFSLYQQPNVDICRICHCEGELCKDELIAPCKCKGSLEFVHHSCLQRWIKSSGNKHCELCKFQFEMNSKLKPFKKWEKLDISKAERRRISCSVGFHLIAIVCVVWSMYVLVEKTATEVEKGELEWPFWTKLVVVAVGLTGAVIFMYMQCKTYINLWKRLKAYNRIIYVQHQPENAIEERKTGTKVTPGPSTRQPNTSREEISIIVDSGCGQKANVA